MFLPCLVCSSLYTSDPWFSHGLCNMWVQLTERSESSPNLQCLLVSRCRYCAGPVRPLAESIQSSSDHCARGSDTDAALSSPVALPRPHQPTQAFGASVTMILRRSMMPDDVDVDQESPTCFTLWTSRFWWWSRRGIVGWQERFHSKSICRSIIKQLPILIF